MMLYIVYSRVHFVHVPYSTKLWREKTLAELQLQENWQRKLWQLAEAKPIQYWSSQDLTAFWQIKLWRIGNKLPNPPKFSPAKVLCYTINKNFHKSPNWL